MKKVLIRIGFIVVLLAIVLSACTPAEPEVVEKIVEVEKEVEKTVEVQVEVIVTATPETVAVEPFRVAYINPSLNADSAWGQAMYESIKNVQNEVGEENFELVFSENMYVVPDAMAAARDYASQGYDLVIAHSAAYGATIADTAVNYPDVSFALSSTASIVSYQEQGVENIFGYAGKCEDQGYLAGVMAAKMTKNGNIGVCGPVDTGDNHLFFAGFNQGVEATNPDAKINSIWTGSFADVPAMTACAETQIQAGADVVAGASQASVGSVALAQEKGVPFFFFQGDYSKMAPKAIVASASYDWTDIIREMMQAHQAGFVGGKTWVATVKNGGLPMVFNPEYEVPADVKAAFDDAYEKIISGEIVVDVE